jgi:hypothetical protein
VPPKDEAAPGCVAGGGVALAPGANGLVEFKPGFMGRKPGLGSRGLRSGEVVDGGVVPPFDGDVPGGNPLGVRRNDGAAPGNDGISVGGLAPGVSELAPGVAGPAPGVAGPAPGVPWPGGGCGELPEVPEGELVPELLPPEFESPELPPDDGEDGEDPNAELAPFDEGAVPEFWASKLPPRRTPATKIAIVCRRKIMRMGKFLRAFRQRAEQPGGII